MGLAIILRKDGKSSYFRRFLLHLIETPGTNRLLLCSGYVSEGKFSILDDPPRMIDAILRGCSDPKSEVVTVAGRFIGKAGSSYNDRYKRFVRKLVKNGINVTPYLAPKKNWHAKIALKLNGECPVAAMIGSSNLTQPAYRDNFSEFSHECDVVLWKNTSGLNNYFRTLVEDSSQSDNPYSPIGVALDREVAQLDESQSLDTVYSNITAVIGTLSPLEL